MMYRSWQTPHPDGPRLSVSFPTSEEMPAEKASLHIWQVSFPPSMSARNDAEPERNRGSVSLSVQFPLRVVISPSRSHRIPNVLSAVSGLDKALAYARHFPAIQWLTSYSEYLEDLTPWYREHVSPKFVYDRNQIMAILNQESSLMEIVKLIGSDVLPDDQKLTLEIARVIRLASCSRTLFTRRTPVFLWKSCS